jgi:hypothetical protein
MQTDIIFPASWFIVCFVGLWTLIFIVGYFYAKKHGQLGDMEQIKFKVFDDGIPNPEPDQQPKRATR